MRHLIKITFLAIALLVGGTTFAQSYKFGHIDSSKLLSIMPERDAAQKQIQAKAMEFDKGIKEMQAEYQRLGQAYIKERETLTDAMRVTKEKEIQDLQNRMQSYDSFAQQEIQKLQGELFKPIYEKAMKAIKDVAEENSFTYIFDVSSGVILFHSNDSQDVTPLVKTKLGIQ